MLYLGFKYEENKRPENWQSSPPAGNKKSARRDSNFKREINIAGRRITCPALPCIQKRYSNER
ncbi:hypothetical protein CLOBOL_02604 [Enterocloster bolteae ATCC BAA-613]|uniref:Uncharacterized protein n=1 Tax=Enterocloster bolteae (strain ATCC BAA-613 / DSM 15670 / CCUG 46953 / JCM 12243 / WAL 16351) TaxID=411902 RepID=A8RPY8_ENTBW|nr:hypothetical protein CLOBOL_02604 [Enterocloster bolteae ATCC BAA-613]